MSLRHFRNIPCIEETFYESLQQQMGFLLLDHKMKSSPNKSYLYLKWFKSSHGTPRCTIFIKYALLYINWSTHAFHYSLSFVLTSVISNEAFVHSSELLYSHCVLFSALVRLTSLMNLFTTEE